MCPHRTGVKCCALNALLQPKVSEILSDHAFTSGKIPFLAGQCCSEIVRGLLSGTVFVRAYWKLRTYNHSHFQPTLSQKHLSPSKLLENVSIQCIPSAYHSFCVTTYIWENGLLPAVCNWRRAFQFLNLHRFMRNYVRYHMFFWWTGISFFVLFLTLLQPSEHCTQEVKY